MCMRAELGWVGKEFYFGLRTLQAKKRRSEPDLHWVDQAADELKCGSLGNIRRLIYPSSFSGTLGLA